MPSLPLILFSLFPLSLIPYPIIPYGIRDYGIMGLDIPLSLSLYSSLIPKGLLVIPSG